jgi:hypothetical protein
LCLDCRDIHNSVARIELQGGVGESIGDLPGVMRYVHRTYKGKRDFGTSCFSARPYAVRRWQHVVAVKTASEMKMYIDGKVCSTAKESQALPNDGYVTVGLLHRGDYSRRFVGQIDEIAIYNRALTEKEIVRHFTTIKQAASPPAPKAKTKQTNGGLKGA